MKRFLWVLFAAVPLVHGGEIEGAWELIGDESRPGVRLKETLFLHGGGRLSIRGEHYFEGRWAVEEDELVFILEINGSEVKRRSRYSVTDNKLILAGGNDLTIEYRRTDLPLPALIEGQWRSRTVGRIKLDLREDWIYEAEEPSADGQQRIMIASPDGLTNLLLLCLPEAAIDDPLNYDFMIKDLFRDFIRELEKRPVDVFVELDGSFFGRAGVSFSAQFDLEGQPVYARAFCLDHVQAYNLVMMSIAAYGQGSELARVVRSVELVGY